MPWVLRALFETAGARMEDALELVPVEPTCRYRWPDGTRFDAFQSLPMLLQAIGQLDPRDVAGFLRFLAYAERIYQAVAGPFLLHPFDGLRDLITPALLRDTWKIDPLRTVDQAVRSFFHSPYLRQVFNRYATYNGSSPYQAPATFNLIAYVEFAEGGWYLRGGMYTLARALERLARRLGVEIHTSSPVERVLVRDGTAHGVALAGGDRMDARAVIVNADPRYAYQALLPEQRRTAARLARLEPSCSGFILLLGIDRTYPSLAHHNIFFSADYQREFRAIFGKRVPAPDPTVYVCATSLSDPTHAPPGHTNLFVLVNAPALDKRVNWGREASGYRDTVIRKLERMGLDALGAAYHLRAHHCARRPPGALQRCRWRNLRPGIEYGPGRPSCARHCARATYSGSTSSAAARTPAAGSRWCCSRGRRWPSACWPTVKYYDLLDRAKICHCHVQQSETSRKITTISSARSAATHRDVSQRLS